MQHKIFPALLAASIVALTAAPPLHSNTAIQLRTPRKPVPSPSSR